MIECILFDSDGTLVDSELLGFEVLVQELEPLGAKPDAGSLHHAYRGWKLANILDELSVRYQLQYPKDFEERFRRRQVEVFEQQLKPIPGVLDVLPQLRQELAVVTSGPPVKVNTALRATGIAEYFGSRIFSAYEMGVWKPNPEIYTRAASDLGYALDKCLVVEDSAIGLKAAVDSGIRTVYLDRFDEPSQENNVIHMTDMAQLPGLVNAL